jgi:hypothetical protein
MIKYTLRCGEGHVFEDWFQSSSDFDRLTQEDSHACPECGSKEVKKTIMAPNVSTSPTNQPNCAASPSCGNMGCPAMRG